MKIDRHSQALILTQSEIQLLFSQGLQSDRDSEALLRSADRALFGICLYCCCRINEACTNVNDVYCFTVSQGIKPKRDRNSPVPHPNANRYKGVR
ncbi:MAG TPA: hypothetical protein V6D43_14375 [Candidatus Sericytochromatia bacterium]|jgi:hypothetical protein